MSSPFTAAPAKLGAAKPRALDRHVSVLQITKEATNEETPPPAATTSSDPKQITRL